MHALHQTLLPSSAVHHSLFLPNFTPSTIYPLPRPQEDDAGPSTEIKVVGNLVVAGGQDLRVFEIREVTLPIASPLPLAADGASGVKLEADVQRGLDEEMAEQVGDTFLDTGPTDTAPVKYEKTQKLNLLVQHQLHGEVTGLAALRTIESSVDGLDRLLVSFKDAKMALLEWSRGDIATVSLHTYERCQQMSTGDLSTYSPILRADPLSRLAVLTLPEDALAVLPLLQDQSELEMLYDNVPRDLPYSPSYVLSLADVSPSIKNVQDLLFLPGYNSPTLALLYTPTFTWSGRYRTARDTYALEIRTVDPASTGSSYPLLTSVTGLPADSLYLVPCPAALGGVVVVTTTGLVHVDQSGRVASARVNGWWDYTTKLASDGSAEHRKLSLEGSKGVFVTERDMLLVLQRGDVHQVRFEMDGRAVGAIKVDEQSSSVPPPSSIVIAGEAAIFVGCAEGDSLLAKVNVQREMVRVEQPESKPYDMEVDYDEDLYGDSGAQAANGHANGHALEVPTGPAKIALAASDVLSGVGKIIDIEFGIAATDQGVRTYPQLVAISGGTRNSTMNVFRRGLPITKRRRFNELANADGVWFLPIQRQHGQKHRNIPESQRSTLLLSSEGTQTRVFALTSQANPQQIGRIAGTTLHAAPFFQRSCVVQLSSTEVALLDSDGKRVQLISAEADAAPIVNASVSDPYIAIRRADGRASFFVGDPVERKVSQVQIGSEEGEQTRYQAIDVFTDSTGVYRTFEPSSSTSSAAADAASLRTAAIRMGQQARMQLTDQQIKRLQEEKPAISAEEVSAEQALHAARGTQWLATLTHDGQLQIRSLPDMTVVLQSIGLSASEASFTDDAAGIGASDEDYPDEVRQMSFLPVGKETPRPHLIVLYASGRLNIYEAQPRFTLDSAQQVRRSLAVRFTKVLTSILPSSNTPATSRPLTYRIMPFDDLEGLTGAFITGEKPHWVVSSDKHPVRMYGLKQAAMAFGRTTHLGGVGEYFIRIEDGSFICYLPPGLNTDFVMPCDRYEMERIYTAIAFDPPSAHYVGASAIAVPFQAYDEEGEIQIGPSGETLTPPLNERSTLELFSQGSDPWRVIDGYDFDQNEVVLALQSVTLESPGAPGGHRDFIAVGTGFDFAEDRATRGNLYVFEVVQTVGDLDKPGSSNWKLKMRTKDPARNPVSSVGNINGYLLNSNGPKLYVKGLDDDAQLMGLAFLDINYYVSSIRVFKNLMLISDLVKSMWFVSLQEDPYKFTTISRDLGHSVVTGDFLVHEGQVTFVSTDPRGTLRLLDFDPLDPDSLGGEKLVMRTEYHLSAPVTASKTIARRRSPEEEFAPQAQLIYADANGALTTVVAVRPARAKRLQLVSDQLVRNAQHVAGLNPRAFRTVRNELLIRPLAKGVLDGDLLAHFALQPTKRQAEMMRQIGTDAGTVANDLQALGGFW